MPPSMKINKQTDNYFKWLGQPLEEGSFKVIICMFMYLHARSLPRLVFGTGDNTDKIQPICSCQSWCFLPRLLYPSIHVIYLFSCSLILHYFQTPVPQEHAIFIFTLTLPFAPTPFLTSSHSTEDISPRLKWFCYYSVRHCQHPPTFKNMLEEMTQIVLFLLIDIQFTYCLNLKKLPHDLDAFANKFVGNC